MYVIANINANPTPLQTYDIQAAPTYLVFQATANVPALAGGAVGLGLDDASGKLFVTYEGSNTIQLVDATTFNVLGTTTAPGASNLAGIVVDQGNGKVYTVDRETNHLYVYSWTAATDTLTLDGGTFKTLTGVSRANGIALDESRGRLFIGDRDSTTVQYFGTSSFTGASTLTAAGSIDLSSEGQTVMGIAIDQVRNILYTGNAYPPYGSLGKLVKHDLGSGVTSAYTLPDAASGDNIVGVAVDEVTGNVYTTTGNQGVGGTDTVIVFDSNLAVLKNDVGDIGDPTGIAIPKTQVSYNPLSFTKTDSPDPVASGNDLTYTLCYDNAANASAVNNVLITDDIPAGTTFVSATGPFSTTPTTVTWSVSSVAPNAAQVCYTLVVNVTATDGSTILNNATIDSDETPPTTQSASTLVSGEGGGGGDTGGIIFTGKGEGAGSAGPVELLLGLLALPLILARRLGHGVRAFLPALLVAALAAPVSHDAMAGSGDKYAGAAIGAAHTNASRSDYDSDLLNLGYTTSSSIDRNTAAWSLFAGYGLNDIWDVEAAYVNLGDVTSTTLVSAPPLTTATAQQQFVDAAATVHPYSVDGVSLTGKANWHVNDRFALFGKLGLFAWKADILVRCSGCATSVSAPKDKVGVDWTAGLGAAYKLSDTLGLRAGYDHFATDRDDVDLLTVGLQYNF
ncbi:MAG: outer membrane beta-barrel protein [Pseudomonadota bacterium]